MTQRLQCDFIVFTGQVIQFSRRAGRRRAKRIKNKACPNLNNPVICVLSSHFLISNSWYCNVPLGVINTSCQTESNAWQLEFNVISATNVRKLWFGLEAAVRLKLSVIVKLLLPFRQGGFKDVWVPPLCSNVMAAPISVPVSENEGSDGNESWMVFNSCDF